MTRSHGGRETRTVECGEEKGRKKNEGKKKESEAAQEFNLKCRSFCVCVGFGDKLLTLQAYNGKSSQRHPWPTWWATSWNERTRTKDDPHDSRCNGILPRKNSHGRRSWFVAVNV